MSSIRNALSLTLEDPEFFKLKNHIPARVGHDGNYYRDGKMDDSMQGEVRSGLIQHDSIPLALHALYREHKAFGLYESERRFLDGNMETLLKYLGKIYITECANMWEMETNVIHAYDVGAIYSAFRMAEELSRDGVISIGVAEIRDIENGLFRGGPLEFLKKFISDGVMYREKGAFQDSPYKDAGVDIAELYLFTLFGINDRSLGIEGIEAATIGEIDRTLFSSNVLPIRWHDDIYFCGGRWLNVGAEFSIYAADNGDIKRSRAIIDYIVGKYGSRLPEQEIVNPARPDVIDHYYVDNGYKVIDDLAWSYSSMLSATSHLLERMERESDRPEPRE
jgi:GH15 family glucan-1,4-alpha-glucosidase